MWRIVCTPSRTRREHRRFAACLWFVVAGFGTTHSEAESRTASTTRTTQGAVVSFFRHKLWIGQTRLWQPARLRQTEMRPPTQGESKGSPNGAATGHRAPRCGAGAGATIALGNVVARLRGILGITVSVELHDHGTLPRSDGKGMRSVDRR